jgi:maltose O-acetyltransferase
MKKEKTKMLAGELYDPLDSELSRERRRCRNLFKRFNDSREDEQDERRRLLAEVLGYPSDAWIQPPFFCDYGCNIALGTKVFFNFNCVVLDVMRVEIGSNVLFGPAVQIYTATHPVSAAERRTWREFAKPVSIGSDVCVGGGAIICPGVTIGDGSVIAAGAWSQARFRRTCLPQAIRAELSVPWIASPTCAESRAGRSEISGLAKKSALQSAW